MRARTASAAFESSDSPSNLRAASKPPSRIVVVDEMRGLAALGVFLFHTAALAGFPKYTLPAFTIFSKSFERVPSVFSFGATGVSLFFVLSGFCLSLQALNRNRSSIPIREYIQSRFARIYPGYVGAVLLSSAVGLFLGLNVNFPIFITYLVFAQGYIQKWYFTLNGSMWSMATEVQFYIIYPSLYYVLSRVRAPIFLLICLFAAILWRVVSFSLPNSATVDGGISYGAFLAAQVPGRLAEFGAGMAVAFLYVNTPEQLKRICRVAVIPVTCAALAARLRGPQWTPEPLLGCMYAVVLGLMLTSRLGARQRDSVAAKFGRASYAFFLVHWPLIKLARYWCGPYLAAEPYERFTELFIASSIITIPVTLLMYFLIEKPLWKKLRPSPATVPSTTAARTDSLELI